MDKITQKAKCFIDKNNLIQNGDKVLAAVSGGADSVCMLNMLLALKNCYNIDIAVAHVNHNLRNDTEQRDYLFTKKLAEDMDLEFFYLSADVAGYALEHHISHEDAGRKIRYDFFDKLLQAHNFSKIATAHNKNDNAETILMNLLRGTTIKGMSGIPAVRGNIIRPILNLTRDEIELFCKENDLSYVTDETNLVPVYKRNKVRLDLIPLIRREYNSNILETITNNVDIISAENDFLNTSANNAYNSVVKQNGSEYVIDIKSLLSYHIALQRRIIYRILESLAGEKHVGMVHTDTVISFINKSNTGKSLNMPGNIKAAISYGDLIISKSVLPAEPIHQNIEFGKEYILNGLKLLFETSTEMTNEKHVYYFDSDKTGTNLFIRTRRAGDKFQPPGMHGTKKLSDYFTDKKIPVSMRDAQLILTDSNDNIICLINSVSDRNYICTSNTKNYLKIKVNEV